MGNVRSDFQFNIKAQADMINADTTKYPIYKYLTAANDGELMRLTKKSVKTNNYTELDYMIKHDVVKFLYNEGKGEYVK